MADPKVRIPIELPPGDMSGAEQAKAEIEEVKVAAVDANLEAQRAADVTEAKRLKALREQGKAAEDAAAKLDKLVNIQRAQVAAQLATVLGNAAGALRQMADAGGDAGKTIGRVASGVEALSGAAAGAAQGFAVGGPAGAAIGGFVGLLSGKLSRTINDTLTDLAALEQSQKNAAAAEKGFQDALRQRRETAQTNSLLQFFDSELGKLKEITREVERQNKLAASRQGLQQEQRATANQAAVAGGADPTAVSANETIARALESIALSKDRVADATRIAEALDVDATAAENKVKALQGRLSGAELDALAKEAEEARTKATEAKENVTDLSQIEADTQQTIIEQTKQAFQGLTDNVGSGITDTVNEAIQAIEAKRIEQGGKLTGLQDQSLNALYEVVRDNIPDSTQVAKIDQALRNYSNAADGRDKGLLDLFQGAIQKIAEDRSRISSLESQLQDLR